MQQKSRNEDNKRMV